jgi:predicted enzyme related to lactoylglutathione lyase
MPNIVHFEIPIDDAERAKKFYTELFGWKVEQFSPGMEYWMINSQEGTGGGMMKRQHPDQKITDYFGVLSVQESADKVQKLGGKVLVPKMAVPNMGYFVICMDTEGNVFGLWEEDPKAKS